ncbi:MAG: hypothetical protein ABW019_08425, partial [Chitinophagaceae bacterium]
MQKLLFPAIALLLFAATASAYPITPRPLRKMIMESQYIIRGTVLETGSLPAEKTHSSSWNSDYAVILVREAWQGRPLPDTITVYYTARLICPAPPVYTKGEEIITFLNKPEKGDGYETQALSYGVKSGLGAAGMNVYHQRTVEMQQILAIKDQQLQAEKTLDWLIECAANPYTRWEGVYELSPGSDFMSVHDKEGGTHRRIFPNRRQQERLFDLLLATDTLAYADMGLVDIVTGLNDAALLGFLKKRLMQVHHLYVWP